MGKQGPCYHCGVTSTPLWRNGPPDKPVLCNACGSRWRTKGSLTNYIPLHSRTGPGELKDYRVSSVTNLPVKNNEPKVIKRKLNPSSILVKGVGSGCNRGLQKVIDEDTSNGSSSGSAMSNADNCVQFDCANTSDLTGPSQSIVWDSTVPSRKRTCVDRPKTTPPLEELTRDLYTILQEQQSSEYSWSCESDLLFESDTPMVSVEIGHGSVLIQHPSEIAKEEESVASSFSVVNKPQKVNEAYSRLNAFSVCSNQEANDLSPGIEKSRKCVGFGVQHDHLRREKTQREILQLLGNLYSSICCVDLKEVLNYDEFEQHLTIEEQLQLLEYLPSIDIAKQPNSLKDMFDSAQFKENISSFQKLLVEGIFNLSFSGAKTEDCKTEIKSKCYNKGSVVQEEPKSAVSGYSTNLKRPCDGQFQNSPDWVKYNNSPPSLGQDLLLEVPPNGSFPEAELLLPTSNFGVQTSTISSFLHQLFRPR